MKKNRKNIIINFLQNNGITDKKEIKDILSGFNITQPVYENQLHRNDVIYQYVRRVDANSKFITIGQWFCLKGASMDSLAIFSGGPGRQLIEFKVKLPIVVLEGTAEKIPDLNWSWSGGGSGGNTQIFIPRKLSYALEIMGTHLGGFL